MTKHSDYDIITKSQENSGKDVRIWRNWQTRMVQVHVIAISWRFKSSYPHPKPSYSCLRVFLTCRCSLMAKHQLPKLRSRVRFPSPASDQRSVSDAGTLLICSEESYGFFIFFIMFSHTFQKTVLLFSEKYGIINMIVWYK